MVIALGALPPSLFMQARSYATWRLRRIFSWVPLLCQFRMSGRQRIRMDDAETSTHRTTGPGRALVYGRLPDMVIALGALPPDLLVRARSYTIWRLQHIFSWVPLFREVRMRDRQGFLQGSEYCAPSPSGMSSKLL